MVRLPRAGGGITFRNPQIDLCSANFGKYSLALIKSVLYICLMKHLLLVMLGGGLGAGGRHLVGLITLRFLGPGFPYGTFSVNVIGSLIMGLFIGWLTRHDLVGLHGLRYFVATGILGGFTTFSAFSLDTAVMWQRGDTGAAMLYVGLSILLSLVAVFAGLFLMRQLGS